MITYRTHGCDSKKVNWLKLWIVKITTLDFFYHFIFNSFCIICKNSSISLLLRVRPNNKIKYKNVDDACSMQHALPFKKLRIIINKNKFTCNFFLQRNDKLLETHIYT
jgi:hypothetical protein